MTINHNIEYPPMTIKEAKENGFMVDTTCYPHYGYKGPRFCPTDKIDVLTEKEALLLKVVELARDFSVKILQKQGLSYDAAELLDETRAAINKTLDLMPPLKERLRS